MKLPTFERLIDGIGSTCLLHGGWQGPVSVELVAAHEGVPMSPRYCCYSAEFALPPGMFLPQCICTVILGEDIWPDLLLTPIGLDEHGRQRMQMIFHYLISQAPAPASANA